ncbi:MAG: thioredoxin [Verrucomicrobiota bacterium]
MAENIKELDDSSFEEAVTGASTPVLVDFWAPWCGPCKAIAPILEELAGEVGETVSICKVNVDQASATAAKFNIRAIPTMLIFKGGEVVEQIVGLTSKDDLKAKLSAAA